jgi:hypothetical protein
MSDGNPPQTDKVEPGAAASPVCTLLVPLAQTPHFELRVDTSCGLVVARRTAAAFQRIGDIEVCFRELEQALAGVDRGRSVLLIDTRKGPSRNDEAFEAAMRRCRGMLLSGFLNRVSIVATAAGSLQIQRYAKTDGTPMLVTMDPKVGFKYLNLVAHEL